MQKTLKKTFALILAVMLCLGVMPLSVFASENHSAEEITSEAASSEPLSESGITDTVTNLFRMKLLNPDPKRLSGNLLR